jgi:3-oxoacyl-[acyl-carrier protein] reductase
MSFEGKTAVVTGAGGGMGLNAARDLLAAGADVTLIDLKERPEGLDDGPGRALYLQGDVGDDGFVGQSIEQTFARTRRFDYLVNAAGVLWFGPLMKRSGGGAMVHVASIQALRGDGKPQDAYQASKAAIIALSKSLAIQFAADSIRSNVLLPGGTDSPMQARWDRDPAMKQAAAAAVPLGRVGTTQDMANAILFLLSDKASFITATELIVDGGRTALP